MDTEQVETILDHRFQDNSETCEYLVQWAKDKETTWEPHTSLVECDQTVAAYWRRRIETEVPGKAYLMAVPNPLSAAVTEHDDDDDDDSNGVLSGVVAGPSKRKVSVGRKPKLSSTADAVDHIATAKRVQQRKRLGNAIARTTKQKAAAAAAAAASAAASARPPPHIENAVKSQTKTATKVKPPPLFAKRSTNISEPMDVDEVETAVCPPDRSPSISVSTCDTLSSRSSTDTLLQPKPAAIVQRARKSTGGRRPTFLSKAK
ncbi:hypothetical protein H4217_002643 [Coemansia sp. RSA 1939]|nr:hypothetical protein H4217_002643 [Coemansia sp. RSA 1939]